MSNELKALFANRVAGDKSALSQAFTANKPMNDLLASLDGLKGNGYEISVTSAAFSGGTMTDDQYNAPEIFRTVSLKTGKKSGFSELTVQMDINGNYSFAVNGDVEADYKATTVANTASNTVQQWLVDVQNNFGIDVLSSALARTAENAARAAADQGRKANPKPS